MPESQCAPYNLLCYLNQYANLILGVVTTAYVILTWRMVVEMRRARENESEPQLISTLVPFAALCAKLRIQNVGPGPALQIIARIQLQPSSEDPTLWCQPALVSGAFEDFLLPDLGHSAQLPSFRQLAEQYDRLIIHLEWSNIFGRKRNTVYEIDLKQQVQGWYSAHRLIQPEEVPEQLAAIQEELKGIKDELQKPNRVRENAQMMKQYRTSRSLLYRLQEWSHALIQRFHTAISPKRE